MISMIAAHDRDLCIGKDGEIPWHLSGDFKNFKKVTTGHPVIMGRKTFDSIGFPLPDRRNIVLTKDEDWYHVGVETCHNYEELLDMPEDVFILGGEKIYRCFLPFAKKLYITFVYGSFKGDTYFPAYEDIKGLKLIKQSDIMEENKIRYKFLEWERNGL